MRHRRTAALLVVVTCALTAGAAERWRAPLDPAAKKAAPERPAEPAGSVDLIVLFKQPVRGITTNAIATRREALDARLSDLHRDLERVDVRRTFHRVLFGASVRVPRDLRAGISALPYVASVHEDRHFQTLLAESVPRINAPKVWAQFGTRGAGITVAVIDTGIDYNHPALGGGFGSGFKVIGGWDFHDDDGDPMDETGHGTHVAGIIAANGAGLLGVAPEVSLIAYRALGSGGGYESNVISAIERSVDPDRDGDPSDHVDVVNMSLGGFARPDDPAADAVEAATAAGVLFCIAAGNWGDYGNILTPATAPSAITVGAADRNDTVADFSSRGPSWNYSIKPEVVAPGVGIVSSIPDGKTAALQGTSMAAPHVTGVAALVKAVHRDWSPAQIKTAIVTSAVPLDGDVMIHGAGRIDALAATTMATLASPALVNFGQVDGTSEVWTPARTVVLRNLSTHPQTLTATTRGRRNGVAVNVTPPTVTIAPGDSATVSIALAVTNAAVPAPQQGSLSYGGRIEWTGGDVPVHVPWAFVKGTFLTITMPDAINDSIAHILGTKWTTNTDFFWDAARVFWPMEKVDVIVNEIGSPSRHTVDRIVAAEQVDTVTTSTVSVHLDDARFTIAASTVGETGTPIGSGGGLCTEQFVFAFPQGRKFTFEQVPQTRARFGPFSSRVKLYTLHSCEDSARATVHAALHEPMQGLQSSVTSTLAPRWWRQEIRFAGAADGQLTGVLPTVRFPGSEESFYFAGGWSYLMRETKPSLTFFHAESPAPEAELMGLLERWSRCYDPGLGHDVDCAYVDHAFVYFNEEDVRVEGDLFFEISPMAYRVPAATTMTLGDAPVWAYVSFYVAPGEWRAGASWMGPLGEYRSFDSQSYRMILRDDAGTILGDGTGLIYKYETLAPGAYHIQSVDTHYAVAGIGGTATATASLDLRRPDPYYPALTGLRVEDANGRQVSVVERGAVATLYVSVADLVREGDYLRRIPPREESTRVEYRRRGTREWRPLVPLVQARHYHNNNYLNAGVGTVYRIDLSAATREVLGAIDIRVSAEDMDGNSIELQLEPALYVGDRPRHRAVRP